MSKTTNRFEQRLPNSDAREELLIVMDYLSNHAYDSKHATTQADIRQYALDKYGKDIRRDRIGDILIHLEQLSQDSSYKLPFTLEVKPLNKTKKYYISKGFLSEEDGVKILTALRKDSGLSPIETALVIERVLQSLFPDEIQNRMVAKAKHRGKAVQKQSEENYVLIDRFNRAVYSHDIMKFKVKNHNKVTYSFSDDFYDDVVKMETETQYGEAYEIRETPDSTHLVIYMGKFKGVIVTNINNLIEVSFNENFSRKKNDYYPFESNRYNDIKDFLDKHYSGQDGIQREFVLKVTINERSFNFEQFKKSFKEHFKTNLVYEEKERIVPFKYYDKDGKEVVENLVAKDAIFKVKCNLDSFYKWYIEKGNFDQVVILSPASYNDRFLSKRIERYCRRLTKYGMGYNYEINITTTPELEARRAEQRRLFLERRRLQRERERFSAKLENKLWNFG